MRKIKIDKEDKIGAVERDVWGSFIEHMGRAVYGGIYQPDHLTADGEGFRGDVLDAVRELRVPIIRYPGGNFLSGYDWRDGIGKFRPVRLELAWGEREPNTVGLHEFASWAKKAGAEIMMSVNLGTGTPKEAAQLVEYCNHPEGTYLSDLRKENGASQPFGIKKWCLGNEMDGPWQICGMKPQEYARKATETAKLMKWVDKDIELIVCGSAAGESFPTWDRIVLEHTYPYVDYLAVHRYYSYTPNRKPFDFMSAHAEFDAYIRNFVATADYVKALTRSKKVMKLSVDEWNVWHMQPTNTCKNTYNDAYENRWAVAPHRVENVYDLADALTLSGVICAMINHADRIKMGCLAQLVNVIAPIMTNEETVCRQSIYYPYMAAIRYAEGDALRIRIPTQTVETENGDAGEVYGACCYRDGNYTLFLLNKTEKEQPYEAAFADVRAEMIERAELRGNLGDFNDFSHPNDVTLRACAAEKGVRDTVAFSLPPYSFTVLRFKEHA